MNLYSETLDAFRSDGAVLLKGYFTDWVEPLRRGVERNLAEPGPFQRIYTPQGGSGRFVGDYCNWARIPEYRDFVFASPAAEIARQLMGSRSARFFHEHILIKEPGTAELTPWHHDQPYYCVDGQQNVRDLRRVRRGLPSLGTLVPPAQIHRRCLRPQD